MLDLILAIAHHLAVFGLVGILAAELVMLRPGITGAALHRLGRIDGAYGGVALLVLVAGFLRVFFGVSGADYYLENPVFWFKIGAFLLVGLLSIQPTIALIRWRREARTASAFVPADAAVARSRQFLLGEVLVLILIPVFAAAMARGYGL
jgi:putative membrane protein